MKYVILSISILILAACPKKPGRDATGYVSKTYVFNLSGSFHGHGDVVAPFWAAVQFKEDDSEINCVLLVDKAASDILSKSFSITPDNSFEKSGCHMIPSNDPHLVPMADVSFEMFIGGRRIQDFIHQDYWNANTITVASDTMHSSYLDEVFVGGMTLFFMPPGIGSQRSGSIDDPDITLFKDEKLRPQTTAALFENPKIKDLIQHSQTKDLLLGFAYGIHNEVIKPELHGQTESFLHELTRAHPEKTIVILTPNTTDHLHQVIHNFPIYTVNNLPNPEELSEQKQLIIVSTSSLSNKQFLGLMAISQVPILIEGDNSITQAIRLRKEFLVLKSPWNEPGIESLLEHDKNASMANLYEGIYTLGGLSHPRWSTYFNKDPLHRRYGPMQTDYYLKDFVKKLKHIVFIAKQIRAKAKKADFEELSLDAGDVYLQYSIIWAAEKAGYVQPSVLENLKKSFIKKGLDPAQIERRFILRDPPHR